MKVERLDAIADVPPAQWNALNHGDCPFLRHEFLHALEQSGSVCADTGWQVAHLIIRQRDHQLCAAMPLYIKSHSYGEYVFDWSWANAYHQAGREYYPKLLSAIPFSPVTSDRLLLATTADREEVCAKMNEAALSLAEDIGASSWHILFPGADEQRRWADQGLLPRTAVQYHWFNDGFECFDDFLKACSSRKRKTLRKERNRVSEQGISLQRIAGEEITDAQWQEFYQFYHYTYMKRGGTGYLNQAFFDAIRQSMPEHLLLVRAEKAGKGVGSALCFFDEQTLYGRYWGCGEEYECLHFEACYYQGIEFCIERGLQRFDPGAQGEHKIARGFIPVFTHSNHWLAEEDFEHAVSRFLKEETEHLLEYRKEACGRLPFQQNYLEQTQLRGVIASGKLKHGSNSHG